mgnify:CR=1 FL=1
MVDLNLLQNIVEHENLVVPTLFKPVQFNIIKKVLSNKKLNENEKRYYRGKMRKKLAALKLIFGESNNSNEIRVFDEIAFFLQQIGSYQITGLSALKHNGYGWYYAPKIIEVLNTKLEGKIIIGNKTLKLIRIKSITKSKTLRDKDDGLIYATNEQIIKDVSITKNKYVKQIWTQMATRYKQLFAKNYLNYVSEQQDKQIDYAIYGV